MKSHTREFFHGLWADRPVVGAGKPDRTSASGRCIACWGLFQRRRESQSPAVCSQLFHYIRIGHPVVDGTVCQFRRHVLPVTARYYV